MALPSPDELPETWLLEIRRRSVAMLRGDAPALNADDAFTLYGQLIAALAEVKRLREEMEADGDPHAFPDADR